MTDLDERLAGYRQWENSDPFEDYVGPLYYKEEKDNYRCAFVVDERHINGQGGLHGGMMMTFGDYAVFFFAKRHLKDIRAVTVTFNSELCAGAGVGDFIEATGEVVHETGGMLFMRGTLFRGETTLLNFSSVLKKLRPKK